MKLTIKHHISQISPQDWQRLNPPGSAVLELEYFKALEASGSIGGESGWLAQHVAFEGADGELLGIVPSYVKSHSWGEFVFDWDWAQAFEQHGCPYYPKLVSTIPFTPISSGKLLSQDLDHRDIVDGMIELCLAQSLNSWHLLFCPKMSLTRDDVFERNTVQFHWFNRDYESFDHFLARFTARQRKNTRKERLSIVNQGLEIRRLAGGDIGPAELNFFYRCYQQPYIKRGHTPHLTKAFFAQIFERMPDNILLVIASKDQDDVASALFLFDESALYGRYWGCVAEFNHLHFELCYYQGIEFCIERKLQHFNPGAQGEHKIKRGFEPVLTYSYHWVKEVGFRAAIGDFCRRERAHYQQYFEQCQQALPFKKDG